MTTLLLFSLPWGYLIAGIFLLLAIILFIVAIFMKDTGEKYDEELETRRYKKTDKDDYETSYEENFDRYQNVTENDTPDDSLQDMIAETSENLAETRKFTPIIDIPEPEPYEEPVQDEVMEIEEAEELPEEEYAAPVTTFADFAEPVMEEAVEAVVAEEAPVEVFEEVAEEIPEEAAADDDEFEEDIRPKKKRFGRITDEADEDEMEVPKPVAKQKSGMSFAEEVRRLIEEEEKKKR